MALHSPSYKNVIAIHRDYYWNVIQFINLNTNKQIELNVGNYISASLYDDTIILPVWNNLLRERFVMEVFGEYKVSRFRDNFINILSGESYSWSNALFLQNTNLTHLKTVVLNIIFIISCIEKKVVKLERPIGSDKYYSVMWVYRNIVLLYGNNAKNWAPSRTPILCITYSATIWYKQSFTPRAERLAESAPAVPVRDTPPCPTTGCPSWMG